LSSLAAAAFIVGEDHLADDGMRAASKNMCSVRQRPMPRAELAGGAERGFGVGADFSVAHGIGPAHECGAVRRGRLDHFHGADEDLALAPSTVMVSPQRAEPTRTVPVSVLIWSAPALQTQSPGRKRHCTLVTPPEGDLALAACMP
jgi:hypothetical protein